MDLLHEWDKYVIVDYIRIVLIQVYPEVIRTHHSRQRNGPEFTNLYQLFGGIIVIISIV